MVSKKKKTFLPVPGESVLVVVDIQEKLLPTFEPLWLESTLKQTELLLLSARHQQIPVLATEQYPQGLGQTTPAIREALDAMSVPVISKNTFSIMGESVFTKSLRKMRRRCVILCGAETHICVTLSALDLVKLGFHVFVASDSLIARSKARHESGLEIMRRAGVEIVNAETLAFFWHHKSGTAEFKEMSSFLRKGK